MEEAGGPRKVEVMGVSCVRVDHLKKLAGDR
jgi:hypothetical protein